MKIKEAIKILNELKEKANIEDMDMNDCFGGEHIEAIEVVLNHLDYWQEKVEKYKFMFQNDVIPKKKIEDKIKEIQKYLKNADQYSIYSESDIIVAEIEILKELLEEKQ